MIAVALLTVCKMRTTISVLKKLTELCNSVSSFIWVKTWGVNGRTLEEMG